MRQYPILGPDEAPTCETCIFAQPVFWEIIRCRRKARYWPFVDTDDWCGEGEWWKEFKDFSNLAVHRVGYSGAVGFARKGKDGEGENGTEG